MTLLEPARHGWLGGEAAVCVAPQARAAPPPGLALSARPLSGSPEEPRSAGLVVTPSEPRARLRRKERQRRRTSLLPPYTPADRQTGRGETDIRLSDRQVEEEDRPVCRQAERQEGYQMGRGRQSSRSTGRQTDKKMLTDSKTKGRWTKRQIRLV